MKPGYTIEEDERILALLNEGLRPREIARKFPNRSYHSIKARIVRLRHGGEKRKRKPPEYRYNATAQHYGGGPIAKMYDRQEAEARIAGIYEGRRYEDATKSMARTVRR